MKIGFDNEKYLALQAEHIRQRMSQFGGKLYLLLASVIILGTVLSFSLFQSGCSIVGSLTGSVLSAVEPIGSVMISVLFLNTRFSWLDILGFTLILITIPIMAIGETRAEAQ